MYLGGTLIVLPSSEINLCCIFSPLHSISLTEKIFNYAFQNNNKQQKSYILCINSYKVGWLVGVVFYGTRSKKGHTAPDTRVREFSAKKA